MRLWSGETARARTTPLASGFQAPSTTPLEAEIRAMLLRFCWVPWSLVKAPPT
jgi:hypothetical protein